MIWCGQVGPRPPATHSEAECIAALVGVLERYEALWRKAVDLGTEAFSKAVREHLESAGGKRKPHG